MKDRKVTAIILAGGKSTRMGYDKAFIKIGGKTIIERTIATLKPIFDDIIIVANEPGKFKGLRVKVVKDIKPNCGPISGIHSGLVHSKTEINFVVACDMPFLNPLVIKYMLQIANGYDMVVVKLKRGLQMLCAVYDKNLISLLEKNLLSGNYTLRDIIRNADFKVITEKDLESLGGSERDFLNINYRKELGKILKRN